MTRDEEYYQLRDRVVELERRCRKAENTANNMRRALRHACMTLAEDLERDRVSGDTEPSPPPSERQP